MRVESKRKIVCVNERERERERERGLLETNRVRDTYR